MEHTTHPLVEKAVKGWLELAEKYGVKTTVERGISHYASDAVSIKFETGYWFESGSVLIYPPSARRGRVRQHPLIGEYRKKNGKTVFGSDPKMTLRRFRDRLIWSWSPTATERLKAQADAARAVVARSEARRAVGA